MFSHPRTSNYVKRFGLLHLHLCPPPSISYSLLFFPSSSLPLGLHGHDHHDDQERLLNSARVMHNADIRIGRYALVKVSSIQQYMYNYIFLLFIKFYSSLPFRGNDFVSSQSRLMHRFSLHLFYFFLF